MTATMTRNRISTHGPAVVGDAEHVCPYKRCGKQFKNAQGVRMHVGRIHTKVIHTASSEAISKGISKGKKAAKTNGAHGTNGVFKAKRKYTRRAKEASIPLLPVSANGMECTITGPGLRIEFSATILPTILHTIAMSIGGK